MTRQRIRRLALGSVVLLLLAALALAVFTLGHPPAPKPLPNPNGYDDFIKAAAALTGDLANASNLGQADLRALVSSNAEALRLVRLGLTRQCLMPLDYTMITNQGPVSLDLELTNSQNRIKLLGEMKPLARLLVSEGKVRELDNRPEEAARSYLDAIRFGNEMSRGGVVITRLVGLASESLGCSGLAKLLPKLGSETDRQILAGLEEVDANRVAWAEVTATETSQFRKQTGYLALRLWFWWSTHRAIERAEGRQKRVVALERLLAAELALRCYRSAQGRVPGRLDDLVPNYLRQVPQDPFRNRPLRYRPQGTNWLLYSVGPDGVDHGGRAVARPAPGAAPTGDLFYDSL